jgi:hypothetical protein
MDFDIGAALRDIAKGNKDALKFIVDFYFWVHAMDDKVDAEGSLTKLVQAQIDFLQTVGTNPFYQANHNKLFSVIQTSLLSYMASERLKNDPNVIDRITAQVLKSEYINVFFAVALLVGGFEHAESMSQKYRRYSFDIEPVKESLAPSA